MTAPADSGPRPPSEVQSDLLARLSHDLRSPLGVVSEAISALRADFEAEFGEDHRMLASLADRGLRRLGRLADLLSLASALDAGGLQLTREPADLVSIARQAIAAASVLEPRREVDLAAVLPEASIPVNADAERLMRALTEILINALRYARSKARIRFEAGPGAKSVRIAIEDDGAGVAEAAKATLFRRFVMRSSRSGLGIGLSIAHDIVVGHQGSIALEASTLPPGRGGAGACFVVTLPTA